MGEAEYTEMRVTYEERESIERRREARSPAYGVETPKSDPVMASIRAQLKLLDGFPRMADWPHQEHWYMVVRRFLVKGVEIGLALHGLDEEAIVDAAVDAIRAEAGGEIAWP